MDSFELAIDDFWHLVHILGLENGKHVVFFKFWTVMLQDLMGIH